MLDDFERGQADDAERRRNRENAASLRSLIKGTCRDCGALAGLFTDDAGKVYCGEHFVQHFGDEATAKAANWWFQAATLRDVVVYANRSEQGRFRLSIRACEDVFSNRIDDLMERGLQELKK